MTKNKETRGLVITTDGKLSYVLLETKPDGSNLAAIQKAVDCHTVDVVRGPGEMDCWIDDEGLFNGADENLVMSLMLYGFNGNPATYRGNGVFLSTDSEGYSISLSDEQELLIRRLHKKSCSLLKEVGVIVDPSTD